MSKKKEIRNAIIDSEQEIEAIEKKLFRSQTVLLLDLLDGKTPDSTEVEFFKLYASLIEKEREHLIQLNEELEGPKNKK